MEAARLPVIVGLVGPEDRMGRVSRRSGLGRSFGRIRVTPPAPQPGLADRWRLR